MKRKVFWRTFILLFLLLFVLIQFIPVDRDVPEYDPNQDFMTSVNPPEHIKSILKVACYDCHSYNTRYPWYAYVAPVSFWIQKHIDHGREEMNFSLWQTYSPDKADHKLEESAEMVAEGEMPLNSYLWSHSDARLTMEQRTALADWFEGLRVRTGD